MTTPPKQYKLGKVIYTYNPHTWDGYKPDDVRVDDMRREALEALGAIPLEEKKIEHVDLSDVWEKYSRTVVENKINEIIDAINEMGEK